MWRHTCYGKDPGVAAAEIKWLIEIKRLMKITEQVNQVAEDLYFIDVNAIKCLYSNSFYRIEFE